MAYAVVGCFLIEKLPRTTGGRKIHYSKVGNTLREKLHEFSGELSPHFSKPNSRFVEQVIYGITVSQDVKLSKIARALEEDIPLKKTVNRLYIGEPIGSIAQRQNSSIWIIQDRR
jgi:hypothetical protein